MLVRGLSPRSLWHLGRGQSPGPVRVIEGDAVGPYLQSLKTVRR